LRYSAWSNLASANEAAASTRAQPVASTAFRMDRFMISLQKFLFFGPMRQPYGAAKATRKRHGATAPLGALCRRFSGQNTACGGWGQGWYSESVCGSTNGHRHQPAVLYFLQTMAEPTFPIPTWAVVVAAILVPILLALGFLTALDWSNRPMSVQEWQSD